MRIYILLVMSLLLAACSDIDQSDVRDGPYVLKLPEQWEALWVCDGLAKSYSFPPLTESRTIEKCGLSANMQPAPAQRPDIIYPAVDKLAVFSDIHGQFSIMTKLLRAHHIIDNDDNWAFGQGHLVLVGDVFDRGPQVTESLWLLYQLEQQAKAAGGQLHFLLGNHEVMTLNGDLRYLNEKYHLVEQVLNRSISTLYASNTLLGQWLQTRNVLVKIGDLLFTHGGLHPDLARQQHTLAQINQVFTAHLRQQPDTPREGFAHYLHKSDGPVWYRGYFRPPQVSEEEINLLKSTYSVSHIIVGHTTQDHVLGLYNNAVIAVDSGIKRGKSGEMLLVEQGKFYRGLIDGSRVPL